MTVKSKIIFTTISLIAVAGIGATVFFGCSSDANKVEQTTTTTIPTTVAPLELEYKDGKKVIEIEEGGTVKAADLPIECEGAGKLAIVFSDTMAQSVKFTISNNIKIKLFSLFTTTFFPKSSNDRSF